MPVRPVSTYSIIAIDKKSGQMGVAVQSHWFSVGSVVPWGEAGVGVVATQAFVEPGYGPLGLRGMRKGVPPEKVLSGLLSKDKTAQSRQVAMLDAKGRVATHTGRKCLPEAGDVQGEGFSAQANLMSSREVWPAMASAFSKSRGPLSQRLMSVLEAAEEAGGDIRGRQSAAMLIVSAKPLRPLWKGRLLDLRVEDNPYPLKELRRLLRINDAYDHANRGDDFLSANKVPDALEEYALAAKGAPEIEELRFWQGVTLLDRGDLRRAKPLLREAFSKRKEWKTVLSSLPKYDLLHVEAAVLDDMLAS
jgi:uncharacterized Ntn-hydrolase superfamily protein